MKMGDKVIVRSNEWAEPLQVGVYNGEHPKYGVPIVEIDGNVDFCMGCVVPWEGDLMADLRRLSPKEQWNRLAKRPIPISPESAEGSPSHPEASPPHTV